MSGFKYYIHLNAQNYLKSGIYRNNDPNASPVSSDIFTSYKNIVNERARSVIGVSLDQISQVQEKSPLAKELESYYQNLYYGNANASIQNTLADFFNRELSPEASVSANNLLKTSVTDINDFSTFQSQFKLESQNLISFLNQQTRITKLKLQGIINQLKNNLENIPNNQMIMKDPQSGKAITAQMFADAVAELQNMLNTTGNTKYVNVGSLNSNGMNWETFKLCSRYFTATSTTVAVHQGRVGEWAAAVAGLIKSYGGRTLAEAEVHNVMQQLESTLSKNVVGSQYVWMAYDPGSGLLDADARSRQDVATSIKQQGLNAEVRGHVSKVDVMLEWPMNDGTTTNVPLSVKNYNSFSGLTIVSGTPLSTLVNYIGGEPHEYHVLNVYTHASELAGFKSIIDEYIYMYAVTTALTGYGSNSRPEIFLVFNNSAKIVRCYDMRFLLAKILSDDMNYTAHAKNISMSMVPSNGDGSLYDEEEQRMSQVFAAYQALKVEVHLSLANAMNY